MARKKANGEGSVYETYLRGKKYYKGTVTIGLDANGKPIRKSFGGYKKSEILDKMNTAKYEAKKQISTTDGNVTFGKLFYSWIYDFKRVEVSNNTFAEYEVCYRLRVEPYSISRKKVVEITLHDLQQYFNNLLATYTPNTVKKTYIKINACFNFALLQGLVLRNFCKGVTLQKVEIKDKYNVFTKEEQEKIIEHLNFNNIVDCLIYFDFYTGLRLGEILGLKWKDIEEKTLLVQRQYQKNIEYIDGKRKLSYVFKKLKTEKSKREIYLPDKAIKLLDGLEKIGELIFCTGTGKPLEVKKPPRRLASICKKLKIPHRSFHSIRQSYATRLFELNVQIKTVQALLGHSEIATTMDIYTHVMKEKKVEAATKLETL